MNQIKIMRKGLAMVTTSLLLTDGTAIAAALWKLCLARVDKLNHNKRV